ncbi:hypothetical protein QDY71_00170 [Kingella negevensis]|uniref:Uncharacterized protein n=1 Tax=Kingella negevensis TaxID=1522312 RepID=A0A238HIW3_9NEIS|nr:hypothetical protein [Kingella negevensis]MDK4679896.1 hypothetical protein [Kingella negevensis]MDK4682385.1 hypothetical protein [Kingella negevensis]MDK4685643.1 hypothetical protein [Kingella negevensis]MDK4690582.1 hypothetical protein [Kingella negevensis]MDK4692070.1 hypothetical protein [Kingella negevensis]
MAKLNKKQSGITFGNILMSLLVLGLFIVIGLMAVLYLEISKTPERTAANFQADSTQPEKIKVEKLSPTNRAKGEVVEKEAGETPVASKENAEAQAASVPEESDNTKINKAILSGGANIQPKKPAPKSVKQNADVSKTHPANETTGERELIPTNVPSGNKQESKPKNDVPTVAKPARRPERTIESKQTGERELKPVERPNRTKSNSESDSISNLF